MLKIYLEDVEGDYYSLWIVDEDKNEKYDVGKIHKSIEKSELINITSEMEQRYNTEESNYYYNAMCYNNNRLTYTEVSIPYLYMNINGDGDEEDYD